VAPNGKMQEVTLSYTVHDDADPHPEVQITSVTCNEASYSGQDYAITDPEHLQLRAQREITNQAGRIYTNEPGRPDLHDYRDGNR